MSPQKDLRNSLEWLVQDMFVLHNSSEWLSTPNQLVKEPSRFAGKYMALIAGTQWQRAK